jgi:hypothetical protein
MESSSTLTLTNLATYHKGISEPGRGLVPALGAAWEASIAPISRSVNLTLIGRTLAVALASIVSSIVLNC